MGKLTCIDLWFIVNKMSYVKSICSLKGNRGIFLSNCSRKLLSSWYNTDYSENKNGIERKMCSAHSNNELFHLFYPEK